MFHHAGGIVCRLPFDAENIDDKLFQHPMTPDHVQGDHFPLVGQGDHIIGGIVQEALLGKGFQGSGHRGVIHLKPFCNLLYPCSLLIFDYMIDGLKVVFKACSQRFFFHQFSC